MAEDFQNLLAWRKNGGEAVKERDFLQEAPQQKNEPVVRDNDEIHSGLEHENRSHNESLDASQKVLYMAVLCWQKVTMGDQ